MFRTAFGKWCQSLNRSSSPKCDRRRLKKRREFCLPPRAEILEDRCVLSADVAVSFLAPVITWTGVEAATPIPIRDSTAEAGFDDRTVLHVAVDPSEWSTRVGGVQINIDFDNQNADLDLYVYRYDANATDGKGELVAYSKIAAGGIDEKTNPDESVFLYKASGDYLVEVEYDLALVPPTGYTGIATITADPNELYPATAARYGLNQNPAYFRENYGGIEGTPGDLAGMADPGLDAAHSPIETTWFDENGTDDPATTDVDERYHTEYMYAAVFRPAVMENGVKVPLKNVPIIVNFNVWGSNGDFTAVGQLQRLVDAGYAFATVHEFGMGQSSGYWDSRGKQAQKAAYDVIEFFGGGTVDPQSGQPLVDWSNGKVAVFGGSSWGCVNAMAATAKPPHLATIVTLGAVQTSMYDWNFHDGVRYNSHDGGADEGATLWAEGASNFAIASPYNPFGQTGAGAKDPLENLSPEAQAHRQENLDHAYDLSPDYDQYWLDRNWVKDAARLAEPAPGTGQEISALVVGAWNDTVFRPSELVHWFEAIPVDDPNTFTDEGVPFKMLRMFAGTHADTNIDKLPAEIQWEKLVHAWLDHFLLGYDTNVTRQPAVISKANDGEFREAQTWPVPGTADVSFFLRAGSQLSLEASAGSDSLGMYTDTGLTTEAQVLAQRYLPAGDFLWFESDPLAAKLRLGGHPTLGLTASTSTLSTHYTPVLFDLGPDGSATPIVRGFLNARYKDGLEQGRDLLPLNESYDATVRFEDCDYVISEGHRLGLAVMSSNAEWAIPDLERATNTLLSGVLHLPVADRTLRIDDVTQAEGDSGTTDFNFTVSLSWPSSQTVTVNYVTADGTARHGTDYLPIEDGLLTFAPGETTKTITVRVKGDTNYEQDETFFVNLMHASGATLAAANAQGCGAICNDDGPPLISISDVEMNEGQLGMTAFVFTVTLSQASEETISVNYATADGTAQAGNDYLATSGTLIFDPGEMVKTITVWVLGDVLKEQDETFYLDLSVIDALFEQPHALGRIWNDDL